MSAPRLLPTSDVLASLRRQGWTYDDIANQYGVTRGAVYLQLKQAKATTDRPRYDELIPWTVRVEHTHAHPAMMLRLLARRRDGKPIPDAKSRMLDKWLRDLEEAGVVVCYDPSQPPNPASPVAGGWYYSRRKPADGDSVIRADSAEAAAV